MIGSNICLQELARGTLRHSPAGSPRTSPQQPQQLYRGQLETIRQRLQLNAIKQQEELAKLQRYVVFPLVVEDDILQP